MAARNLLIAVSATALLDISQTVSPSFTGKLNSVHLGSTTDVSFLSNEIEPRRLRKRSTFGTISMSKKDQRYKLAKRQEDEDRLLLAVADQFRRREGQAQISWYPGDCIIEVNLCREHEIYKLLAQFAGHIAQAEKRLHEVLGSVDVVVEVRDARIPASTTHPMVDDWLRNRNAQRVVAMTKIDLAPKYVV